MKQSENLNELFTALAKAQGEFRTAKKNTTNPFFKSKYADLEEVVDACRQSLSKNGLSFMQMTELTKDGLILNTRVCHSSGQWIESEYPIDPVKKDPQGLGSAITYAKRYALGAMLGVVSEEEDDDGEAATGRSPDKSNYNKLTNQLCKDARIENLKKVQQKIDSTAPQKQAPTPEQKQPTNFLNEKEKLVNELRLKFEALGVSEMMILNKYTIKSMVELTQLQINDLFEIGKDIKSGSMLNKYF